MPTRILAAKGFDRFARKAKVADTALVAEHRAVFVAGFAKNDLSNVGDATLAELRQDARALLTMADPALDDLVRAGELREIDRG